MVALPRTFTPTVSEETLKDQTRLLKALADDKRLMILHLLRQHSPNISVAELTECLGIEQPTTSHHLRILRDARIIDCRKSGLYTLYHIRPEMLHIAIAALDAVIPAYEALSVAG